MITMLWFSGCINTVRFPPDLWGSTATWWESADTGFRPGTNPGPAPASGRRTVTRLFGGCDRDTSALDYTIITDGWLGSATFTTYRSLDMRSEHHPMELVDADPNGGWDRWNIGLDYLPEAPEPAVATAGDCNLAPGLTYAVRLHHATGVSLYCMVWSDDADAIADRIELEAHLHDIDPSLGTLACDDTFSL